MHSTRFLTSLGFVLVLTTPACEGQFVQLGTDDAGVGGSGAAVGGAWSTNGGSVTAGTNCVYNGVTYAEGVDFNSTDGCNTCRCGSNGAVACTEMGCGVNGGASGVGGVASAGTATSAGGSVACPTIDIAPPCSNYKITYDSNTGCVSGYRCLESDASSCDCAGPMPICADGGQTASCITLSDGTCGWLLDCPPTGAGGATAAGGSTSIGVGAAGSSSAGASTIAICFDSASVPHYAGEVFKSTDGCNTCGCSSAGLVCSTMDCLTASSCPAVDPVVPSCESGYEAVFETDPATRCPKGFACQIIIN